MQFIKSLLLLCRGGDWGVGALQNFFEPPDILFNLKLWFAWIGRFKIAVEVSKCFFSADILTIWYWYRYMQCKADYVGYTRRHLHQRIAEHKYSAVGKHIAKNHKNCSYQDAEFFFSILSEKTRRSITICRC